MNPNIAIAILVGLVAVASLLGILVRATQTRIRSAHATRQIPNSERIDAVSLAAGDLPAPVLGQKLTLLQFSTEFCARCPATSRTLTAAAQGYDGVEHIDVDVTRRDDLIARFSILRTPTVLLADGSGRVLARVSGPIGASQALDLIEQHLDPDPADEPRLERSHA